VWRWEDVKMRRCEKEKMWREDEGWGEDVRIRRWEDVKMKKYEDEKIFYRPIIGRTCA
jgi:hypothetical protein